MIMILAFNLLQAILKSCYLNALLMGQWNNQLIIDDEKSLEICYYNF